MKVLAAIGLATYAQVGKQATTLNRIDERTRKEAEKRKCKQERDAVDLELWKIWKDYQQGRYGERLSKTKPAEKDLLYHPMTRGKVAELGFLSEKSVELAIRRADRKVKKKNANAE